jgi:hypothetical protein
MSEHPQPGMHPDADVLSAFVEGALPEHERLQCLAHLAECSRCREVAFLAQEPQPARVTPTPAPWWRRWSAPVPVLAATTAACIAVLAVSLYLHYTARRPASDTAPPSAEIQVHAQLPPATPKATPHAKPRSQPGSVRAGSRETAFAAPRPAAPPSLPAPPAIQAQSSIIQNQPLALPTASLPHIPPPASPATGLSGIIGLVTDPSGAAIPAATVTLRQLNGTLSSSAQTDVAGKFKLAGLPAGRYELEIEAPGFRQTSRQVELPPQDVAVVASRLEIGAASEAIEVAAAPPMIQSETASIAPGPPRRSAPPAGPRPLPSKLPAAITVVSGKVTLAVDSAGTLFFSRNAGRSWKAIKPVWLGKVARVVALEPPPTPTAKFQLTTDTGSTWLSRDGRHWYPAPSQR